MANGLPVAANGHDVAPIYVSYLKELFGRRRECFADCAVGDSDRMEIIVLTLGDGSHRGSKIMRVLGGGVLL